MSGKASPSQCKSLLCEIDYLNTSKTKKKCIRLLCEMKIPQKPILDKYIYKRFGGGVCPNCKKEFSQYPPYCKNCGQALDWSE